MGYSIDCQGNHKPVGTAHNTVLKTDKEKIYAEIVYAFKKLKNKTGSISRVLSCTEMQLSSFIYAAYPP